MPEVQRPGTVHQPHGMAVITRCMGGAGGRIAGPRHAHDLVIAGAHARRRARCDGVRPRRGHRERALRHPDQ